MSSEERECLHVHLVTKTSICDDLKLVRVNRLHSRRVRTRSVSSLRAPTRDNLRRLADHEVVKVKKRKFAIDEIESREKVEVHDTHIGKAASVPHLLQCWAT